MSSCLQYSETRTSTINGGTYRYKAGIEIVDGPRRVHAQIDFAANAPTVFPTNHAYVEARAYRNAELKYAASATNTRGSTGSIAIDLYCGTSLCPSGPYTSHGRIRVKSGGVWHERWTYQSPAVGM